MPPPNNIWPKHITVDKRIVKILSGSTYTNFPSAIRELIVNSYDADAENVTVDIDLQKEIISLRDDGKGMSEQDFDFYLRIAGKTRKKDETLTNAKRPIVGQFGVGFLSVLPFCKKYLIETKRKGTDEIVHATITSTEYFANESSSIDVNAIPIYGGLKYDKSLFHEQFTRIRLVGFSKLAKSFFNKDYAVKGRRNTINNYEPLDLVKWNLCEYLPLNYNLGEANGKKLQAIFQSLSPISFNVFLNKELLFRNIHANNILEISSRNEVIGNIIFKYVILTDYTPLNPKEARYLMQRNLNVGVGERTAFDLGMDGKVYGKLAHLTGEVNIISGLNDLISVSRDKFNFSPDYELLKEFLRQKLSKWANELDNLQILQKSISDLTDTTKVISIENLKKENVAQDINELKSKGYLVTAKGNLQNNSKSNLNKSTKEVFVPDNLDTYSKTISVLDNNYKLVLERWNFNNEEFPAVKFQRGKTYVNEAYPLFQNKSNFDTFLKLHILMLNYLKSDKIGKSAYQSFLNDILIIFNKTSND